jgi:hypothetical protein
MTAHQRRAYAARRMSLAVDRQILAPLDQDKARAGRWVLAWAALAGLTPPRRPLRRF